MITIISGCADGADKLGEQFAEEYDLNLERFPADWKKYGSYAGPVRNRLMTIFAKGDESAFPFLFAFWNNRSSGTLDMINRAKSMGLTYHVFPYTSGDAKYSVGDKVLLTKEIGGITDINIYTIRVVHDTNTYDLELNAEPAYMFMPEWMLTKVL